MWSWSLIVSVVFSCNLSTIDWSEKGWGQEICCVTWLWLPSCPGWLPASLGTRPAAPRQGWILWSKIVKLNERWLDNRLAELKVSHKFQIIWIQVCFGAYSKFSCFLNKTPFFLLHFSKISPLPLWGWERWGQSRASWGHSPVWSPVPST